MKYTHAYFMTEPSKINDYICAPTCIISFDHSEDFRKLLSNYLDRADSWGSIHFKVSSSCRLHPKFSPICSSLGLL